MAIIKTSKRTVAKQPIKTKCHGKPIWNREKTRILDYAILNYKSLLICHVNVLLSLILCLCDALQLLQANILSGLTGFICV